MLTDLSPKAQFQSSAKNREEFTRIVAEPVLRMALTYAMGELIMTAVTTEELNGARKFITMFYTLADLPSQQRMPEKNLTTLGGNPPAKPAK